MLVYLQICSGGRGLFFATESRIVAGKQLV
jgi:hypothetical protein